MTTKTRRVMKRKKRMEFRLVLAAVFCLLLVASFGKLRLQQKNETYQQQEEELLAQISEEEERTEEIEELKKYVQTKKYVEEVAKERLGLVYEDEFFLKGKKGPGNVFKGFWRGGGGHPARPPRRFCRYRARGIYEGENCREA